MCSANVIIMLTIAAWTMGAASMAHAQQNAGDIIDAGMADYGSHCAACHGASGAGDGPYAHFLNVPIPNLTRLAERNGGAFPYFQVYETINGTWVLPGHGERNMPIWGQEFSYKKSPRIPKSSCVPK